MVWSYVEYARTPTACTFVEYGRDDVSQAEGCLCIRMRFIRITTSIYCEVFKLILFINARNSFYLLLLVEFYTQFWLKPVMLFDRIMEQEVIICIRKVYNTRTFINCVTAGLSSKPFKNTKSVSLAPTCLASSSEWSRTYW